MRRRRATEDAKSRHSLVGPPHLAEQKRRFQYEFLTGAGLRPAHTLVDLGCGTLRGGIPLIAYLDPGHYTGIEAREEVLEEGRRELAEAGLEDRNPRLICASEPGSIALDGPFDYAWAYSVLGHMYDEQVKGYLALLARTLAPNGSFYANVWLGEGSPDRWQGFPVIPRPREAYEQWAAAAGLATEDLGGLRDLGHRMGHGDGATMLRFHGPGRT